MVTELTGQTLHSKVKRGKYFLKLILLHLVT